MNKITLKKTIHPITNEDSLEFYQGDREVWMEAVSGISFNSIVPLRSEKQMLQRLKYVGVEHITVL